MQEKRLFVLCALSVVMFCANVCVVFAKAPTTAKILFGASREGNRDLYLMNPDGSEQINITNHRADDIYGAWSPTGEQILFASDRDEWYDLYLMDADGQNVRRVFGKSAHRETPTWSPDGKQIAYTRREQGKWFIYIASIDSEKEERVAIGGAPAWSPNGTEIAFITGARERKQLSVLNLRTRKENILFPPKATPSWIGSIPVWSSTGDRIAFSWLHRVPLKDFVETETIYIVNRDGTGLLQIIEEADQRATDPAWAPRGDELLYSRWKQGTKQIFKIALNGGQPKQLTHLGIWNTPSDWFDPAYALPVSPQPQLLTTTWGDVKQGN